MADITGFQCNSCGKCCLDGASRLLAGEKDITMWEKHAPTVLDYVNVQGQPGQRIGDLWTNPETGKDMIQCPWIKQLPGRELYYCRIYQWRPQVCRQYPTSQEHARYTDCPGIIENKN